MPPKRRRQSSISSSLSLEYQPELSSSASSVTQELGTSSPAQKQHLGPSSTQPPLVSPRRTRSGKVFVSTLPSATVPRKKRNQGPVTPHAKQTLHEVRIVDGNSSEIDACRPRHQRQRRGKGPRELTLLPKDKNLQSSLAASTDSNGGVGTGLARCITFPWGFSIPVTAQGHPDRDHPNFSRAQEADMKSVLKRIGCSVVGKSRDQLINLCIAYATVIQSLPAPTVQSLPVPNPTTASSSSCTPGQRKVPSHTSQPPERAPITEAPLIQLDSPLSTIGSTPSSSSSSSSNRTLKLGNAPPSSFPGLPSSLPGLIPDLPTCDSDHDDSNSRHNSPAKSVLSTLQENQVMMLRLIQMQSDKMSNVEESVSSIAEHQRDLKEKMEEISDKLEYTSRTSRSKRKSGTKKPPTVSRTGKLKDLIQFHFQALFGLPEDADLPPSPPTKLEKSRWLRTDPDELSSEADGNSETNQRSDSNSTDDETPDPQFPYRGGPGHRWATQEQLKIMHGMMSERNMRRFRMDFNSPLSAPENQFCLNLARDIFIELVDCGEYDGLEPHECTPEVILHQLTDFARGRYVRKLRETKSWPTEKQQTRVKSGIRRTRRTTLRKFRLETCVEIGGLRALHPIINACTSDDETDDDIRPVATSSKSKYLAQKMCKVCRLEWRNQGLTDIFILLDEYRDRKLAKKTSSSKGAPGRIRRRTQNPAASKIPPPKGLSRDCFDDSWFERQNQVLIESLEPTSDNVIKKALKKLKSVVKT